MENIPWFIDGWSKTRFIDSIVDSTINHNSNRECKLFYLLQQGLDSKQPFHWNIFSNRFRERTWSSASVGFWPRERITVPNSLVVIVPSPSLSKREKASLNSVKQWAISLTKEVGNTSSMNKEMTTEPLRDSYWLLMFFKIDHTYPVCLQIQGFPGAKSFWSANAQKKIVKLSWQNT